MRVTLNVSEILLDKESYSLQHSLSVNPSHGLCADFGDIPLSACLLARLQTSRGPMVRVDDLLPKVIWSKRYDQINDFERGSNIAMGV
jgi:hypothetical protein